PHGLRGARSEHRRATRRGRRARERSHASARRRPSASWWAPPARRPPAFVRPYFFFAGVTALYAAFQSEVSTMSLHFGGLPAEMLPSFTFSKTVRVIGATPSPLRFSGHQLSFRYSFSAVFVTARLCPTTRPMVATRFKAFGLFMYRIVWMSAFRKLMKSARRDWMFERSPTSMS